MTETQEKLKSLFHPGAGRIPPHLTGRKQEQDFFHDCVARLLDRTSPDQDMIIYGPRGNGKTAMLRYLQKETLEKTGKRLDIAWVTPRKLKTVDELARAISGKDRKILEKVKSLGLSASIGIASLNAELDISRAAAVTEDLLQEKSRKTPLVLIMDEAHNLTPDMAGILLD
ncbi:MAG: ATP-binding protein, partial [Gammaproteobacteria bacterium]|nr:ATP-binding protein [Gammaproteobacteria bacterium]